MNTMFGTWLYRVMMNINGMFEGQEGQESQESQGHRSKDEVTRPKTLFRTMINIGMLTDPGSQVNL